VLTVEADRGACSQVVAIVVDGSQVGAPMGRPWPDTADRFTDSASAHGVEPAK